MPVEIHNQWKRLGSAMEINWTADRATALKNRVKLRFEQRRKRNMIAVAALSIALIGGVIFAVSAKRPTTTPSVASREILTIDTPDNHQMDKEPLVTALNTGTRFTMEDGEFKRTYWLIDGAARFEKGIDVGKSLEVRVGSLIIEDIGTIFTVEKLPEDRALVAVADGAVRVSWTGGQEVVGSGEEKVFPPKKSELTKSTTAKTTTGSQTLKTEDWRMLAHRGQYQQAYRLIAKDPSRVKNRVDDQLLAADVMRLSNQPNRAVGYLERVVSDYSGDPRSKLAAFTLGRVFLDELGIPRQAAQAFAFARRGQSPLAEESLAREVEAWSRAGEVDRARSAAELYLLKYPSGTSIDVVRAFGGLESD